MTILARKPAPNCQRFEETIAHCRAEDLRVACCSRQICFMVAGSAMPVAGALELRSRSAFESSNGRPRGR